jgi:hypothetical protein
MTVGSTPSTLNVRSDLVGRIMSIGVAALFSTLAATLTVSVIAFIALLPFSAMFLEPSVLIPSLFYAAGLSAPNTLVLLPVAAIFLRPNISTVIILSIVGSIGGVISAWLSSFFMLIDPIFLSLAVAIGAIGGLVAGVCFGLALMRLGK